MVGPDEAQRLFSQGAQAEALQVQHPSRGELSSSAVNTLVGKALDLAQVCAQQRQLVPGPPFAVPQLCCCQRRAPGTGHAAGRLLEV